jgi:CSLREA domain-containing protein
MRSFIQNLAILALLLNALASAAAAPRIQGVTIAVTTHADELNADGACSLREAIQAANSDTPVDACPAGSGADTIVLAAGLYALSLAGADEDQNQTGDLDLAGALTIRGVDYGNTVVDAAGLGDRAMQILDGANVTLQGLSIARAGDSANTQLDGGGILIGAATVILRRVEIVSTAAGRNGGGIYNAGGQLSIVESLVSGSTAGVLSSSAGSGGGIYNAGGLIALDKSIVNDNIARDGDGGGIYSTGQIRVNNSWIHDNSTNANGAGIYSNATAVITGTVLDSNRTSGHGGNIYSGALDEASSLTLVSSELRLGQGDQGGGIYNQGALQVLSSSFAFNHATSGSALYSAALTQTGELRNATIVSNTLETAASAALHNAGTAVITLYNTLLGQNDTHPNCAGTGPIVSGGHNLDFGAGCGFQASGDITSDPKLGPLPAASSSPSTFPVGIGSPAVNSGDNATCAPLDLYQQPRPHGINCDIGAFEMNTAPTAGPAESYTIAEDTPLNVAAPGLLSNDADPDNDPLKVVLASGTTHGALNLSADGAFLYTPAANYYGPDQFAYRASDGTLTTALVVVQISVTSVDDPPIVGNDAFSIASPTPLAIATATLLDNDSDVENDALTVTAAGPVSARGGSAALKGTTITYTPPRNYTGTDTFGYTVSDGHGGVSNGLVSITITARYIFLPLTLR